MRHPMLSYISVESFVIKFFLLIISLDSHENVKDLMMM